MSYNSDNNLKSFSDRLNKACDKANIPLRGRARYLQERLSDKISLVGVRKWLVGESIPDTKRLPEIADIVNSTVEELLGGKPSNVISDLIAWESPTPVRTREVPLISWVQAGEFCNSETQVLPLDCETIPCPNKDASSRTFALRVVGDSMTAPYGRSYPEGTVIFVDPEKVAVPGQRIIAITHKGHTFKELAENEFGQQYLKALNPSHPPIFEDDIGICGVVLGSYMPE
ncbi:Cro/Cl family transcriptional regulator [Vibrio fluvialis]|uniref:LexA family protein n=1 Tax=Vibrio fluvialis TaxID=676 RepID=UPI001EEA07D6|nr:S24 family peptidase [Vibrio fluvialis]MCG6400181.1 S24 family peptidase [Vibrio fluvialis]